ncbi:MAG: hypothetical protein R3305_02725 [Gammaproteobacteria bacterium]|nr:hypothetical protein [Gammaproteobacteria bacterium]
MNTNDKDNGFGSRIGKLYEYGLEILLFVLITPALVTGLEALERIPV